MIAFKWLVTAFDQSAQRSALSTKASPLQKKEAFDGCADTINNVPSPSPTLCCLLAFYIFFLTFLLLACFFHLILKHKKDELAFASWLLSSTAVLVSAIDFAGPQQVNPQL